MITIYVGLDIQNNTNDLIGASTSRAKLSREIVEWLKDQYTANEWSDFLQECGGYSDEDVVNGFALGDNSILEKFDIAIEEFYEEID